MGDVLLKYATAQPLCVLHNDNTDTYIFFADGITSPEFVVNRKGIKDVISGGGNTFFKSADNYTIKVNKAGTNCLIKFNLTNGKHLQILTITKEQAMDSWKIKLQGKEYLIISLDDLIVLNDSIRLQTMRSSTFEWSVFPSIFFIKSNQHELLKPLKDGLFSHYTIKLPEIKYNFLWKEDSVLAGKLTLAVPRKNKGADSSNFSLPLYNTTLQAVPGARYYVVEGLPDLESSKNVSNAFIKIDYVGDTQAAYLNGNLIADDFYKGEPMIIAVKPFAKEMSGNKITLLVTPQSSDRKIFFEEKVKPLQRNPTGVRQVEIITQYQVFLTAEKNQ